MFFQCNGNNKKLRILKTDYNPRLANPFTLDISDYPNLTVNDVYVVWGNGSDNDNTENIHIPTGNSQKYLKPFITINNNTLNITWKTMPMNSVWSTEYPLGNGCYTILAYC